jgi:hypothetical protein
MSVEAFYSTYDSAPLKVDVHGYCNCKSLTVDKVNQPMNS